jgi:bacterioferritin-associated ferredoxin
MYICLCKGITDKQVRKLGESGVTSPHALIQILGLESDECCGFCAHHIGRMVAIANGEDPLKYGRFRIDPEMQIPIDDPDSAP